jgi:ADP-ribosylglycohydrolase
MEGLHGGAEFTGLPVFINPTDDLIIGKRMKKSATTVLKKKIHGCLAAIAVGDALGYPVHELSQDEIHRRFGGPITSFHPPVADNPYHKNMGPGQITDDTIMTLLVAEALIEAAGPLDARYFGDRIAEWARSNSVWETSPMFGPTTKNRLVRLIAGEDPVEVGTSGSRSTDGATNGAAMRIAPAGLVNPGDPERAVQLSVQVSLPTHGTVAAISAAAAIAAGVAAALAEGADVLSVAEAAITGARRGELLGRDRARDVPAPDISFRMERGIAAVLAKADIYESCRRITDAVGNGMAAYETVPAAVSLFVAARGDPESAILGGANMGGDTDTIGSIAGGLAGALRGIEEVPQGLYRTVEEVNGLDLGGVSERLLGAVERLKDNSGWIT